MIINSIGDFRRLIHAGAYAWPGGYPVYFITADGAALSYDTAKQNKRDILSAISNDDKQCGWRVTACEINWEDESLTCEHSGKIIPSAYGETNEGASNV